MYISPILVGVAGTIIVELLIVVLCVIYSTSKGDRKDDRND